MKENMDDITVENLDILGVFWEDVAIKVSGKTISYGDLVHALIISNDMIAASHLVGTSHRTLDRRLPILFPDKPRSLKWGQYFLYKTNRKECTECKILKGFECFSKETASITTGLKSTCKECDSTSYKKYLNTGDTREKRAEYLREYYRDNPGIYDTYRDSHKGEIRSWGAKRRATKLKATPFWSETKLIAELYKAAPEGYHVDHIVPLQHDKVCGLHVLANLKAIPAFDNMSKGNTFITDWE